jgi:hypothetical protein
MQIPNTYLFVATFSDGSQIFQNEDDVSPNNPEKNCFFDVMQRIEAGDMPISFGLVGERGFLGVDLRDGHFEVNGLPFFQHRPEQPDQRYKDFRLIYFRSPRIDIEMNTETGEQTPVRGYVSSYTFGWQVTHNGSNVQRTFTVYFE